MLHKILPLLLVAISLPSEASQLRIGTMAGYGGSVVSVSSLVRTEEPLGFSFFIDYALHARLGLSAEHTRTLKGSSTGVGFTGLAGRWYPWTPMPQWVKDSSEESGTVTIVQKNLTPYVGLGVGFAQASLPARSTSESDATSVGVMVSPKLGLELPLGGRFGARGEGSYGMTVIGSPGKIQMLTLFVGVYMYL